jgi:hypothetical protein
MKAASKIATYRHLRQKPHWRLLAADHGPTIIALLQSHFVDNERSIPASIFYERINHDLEVLRASGDEDTPKTAQAYIADWLAQGFLERHYPAHASEEVYELSLAATTAIRFVSGLIEPRTAATESRLATVIQQLTQLSEETELNPQARIAALTAERERIDLEIEAIQQGRMKALPDVAALERVREIIGLADDLIGDFHRVRDEFAHLNRDLRRQIMDNDGNRGEILNALFAGVDLIATSDAGRTFSAFYRLLIDPEQNATLEHTLETIMNRDFSRLLDARDRRFLIRLTRTLLDQSGTVHEVLQHFARSLKHFVQSREFFEHRRLNQLIKIAQQHAVAIKDDMKIHHSLEYSLVLTSSKLRSLSQWILHDPSLNVIDSGMQMAETSSINLETIHDLVAQSEIDFRTLKANILFLLKERSQICISEVLSLFSPTQGLGTIVGYMALGSRHGLLTKDAEKVCWMAADQIQRCAHIPVIYFLRERSNELESR